MLLSYPITGSAKSACCTLLNVQQLVAAGACGSHDGCDVISQLPPTLTSHDSSSAAGSGRVVSVAEWVLMVCRSSTTYHCKTCFFSPENKGRSCHRKTHIPLLQLITSVPYIYILYLRLGPAFNSPTLSVLRITWTIMHLRIYVQC